jgi:PilZ domain
MFSAELKVESDSRVARRIALSVPGRIESGDSPRCLCRVTNLSKSGARLMLFSDIDLGATVELTLPGSITRKARVAWVGDYEAGCAFDEALDEAFVEELARVYHFDDTDDRPALPRVKH